MPHRLAGARIGLLCHAASVDGRLRHTLERLREVAGGRLVRVFGPEHGVWGVAQDMVPVASQAADPVGGLPVISLYGDRYESLRPTAAQLADLDVLVVDLQDVGSRYYTYAWTALLCVEACAEVGVSVLVCDRPNPIGGEGIEGGGIAPGFESFVGLHDVPNRHGMTLGELVDLARAERRIQLDFTVIPVNGWSRADLHDATGLPWVLPSPNMPTLNTALVYPGMCLVEATTLSEGRGTTRPFEWVGAPGIDPFRLAAALEEQDLPGVSFRPIWFRPGFQKHAGRDCGGVELQVWDRVAFRPVRTGVTILWVIRRLFPEAFGWRERPYEFVSDIPAIDLLTGSEAVRHAVWDGAPLDPIFAAWQQAAQAFRARRAPFLRTPSESTFGGSP